MKRLIPLILAQIVAVAVAAQSLHIESTPSARAAATVLDSLLRIGGCTPSTSGRHADFHIYVGLDDKQRQQFETDVASLRDDGYLIVCDGRNAYLDGAGEKGTLYAVYAFLEKLGFRLYTPEAMVVPNLRQLHLPVCHEVSNPSFAYREVAYRYPNQSRLYADWHHLHTQADRHTEWGMYVHTFAKLIPPSRYYDSHPEWFSLNNGRRSRDGQLCLTNPTLFDTLCARLADTMSQHPEARIWSVSPNDNYNACQCEVCQRSDQRLGGPTGTLLEFVNRVAQRFPDKTISTLAYQYSRAASAVRPADNVLIMLCPIEAGRERPIEQTEPSFCRDMADWSMLTNNIYLWDYVVQFRNFWNPFPNLHVLQPNLRFFHNNGVRRMFEQASGAENVTSWMDIRCYMIAKLMWDVDADLDSIMDDFFRGYYGNQGHYVAEVIASMTSLLLLSGRRLDIYGYPIDGTATASDSWPGYLSPQAMELYYDLVRRAEAEATDSAVVERLRFFRMALDFARVELDYDMTSASGRLSAIDSLERDLLHFGVPQMMEMGHSPSEYATQMRHWARKLDTNLACHSVCSLRHRPTPPYDHGSLTDGEVGIMDYRHSWLGFWGDTIDAVVDLGRDTVLHSVSIDFYHFPLSWIFAPERVRIAFSADGVQWSTWHEFSPEMPQVLARPDIYTCQVELTPTTDGEAARWRYVRVMAEPLAEIPSWHRAAGQRAWVFADEIIVR